jgi:hypothetical protein
MAGGLLNLISASTSEANYIIGNPKVSFFYSTWNQHVNFGMQKFRIDYTGNQDLQQNGSTTFNFPIPRHADLLLNTCLVLKLPHIWSHIYTHNDTDGSYNCPYEFKWIKNIGCQLIEEVSLYADGTVLQKYSGYYLRNMVERDFDNTKKDLFDKMTGNIPQLYDPVKCSNNGKYPNALSQNNNENTVNPSINDRMLYIPLNMWFSMSTYQALPLVSLQYHGLSIKVTLRPLNELYIIRDVLNPDLNKYENTKYRVASGETSEHLSQFTKSSISTGENDIRLPSFDIHLMSTYVFLSEDQRNHFAKNDIKYLFKEVREYTVHNIIGNYKLDTHSHGLITNWMWFFQRSDIAKRNEWNNYTNLEYENTNQYNNKYFFDLSNSPNIYSGDNSNNLIYYTPEFELKDTEEIMQSMAIICDGAYRENEQPSGVYNYLEKYNLTSGNAVSGLYCYSFSLDTNSSKIQPSGVFNTNFFKKTEFEIKTITPNLDPNNTVSVKCDENGAIISVNKSNKNLYEYTYNLTLQEERYNFFIFQNGMVNKKMMG